MFNQPSLPLKDHLNLAIRTQNIKGIGNPFAPVFNSSLKPFSQPPKIYKFSTDPNPQKKPFVDSTTPVLRSSKFENFQDPTFQIHLFKYQDQPLTTLCRLIFTSSLCITFFHLFQIGFYKYACFGFCLLFFAMTCSSIFMEIHNRTNFFKKSPDIPQTPPVNVQFPEFLKQSPSENFLRTSENLQIPSYSIINSDSTSNFYRPFVLSDRAKSEFSTPAFPISTDTNIDQLARESLRKLKISPFYFSQYLSNFKTLISKTLLSKLENILQSDHPMLELMLSVPTFDHYRNYIIQRIHALAGTQFLAGHFGEKGDRWKDREWNTDMPSDNQIILHLFGCWVSYFMNGKKGEQSSKYF
jgi:hypothetical protein